MTNQANGETQSEEYSSRLDDLEKIIQEYENSLIGAPYNNAEYEQYLKLNRKQIELMDDNECFSSSYMIAQQILYVQRQINRDSARVKWCNATTNALSASHWNDYDQFTKGEIKLQLIIRDNDFLQKVQKIKNIAEQRIERFHNITLNLKYMSDILMEIGKSKRWNKKNE